MCIQTYLRLLLIKFHYSEQMKHDTHDAWNKQNVTTYTYSLLMYNELGIESKLKAKLSLPH